MRVDVSLPQFRLIDEGLRSIGKLADYDPLFDVARQQFLRQMNYHLTSLAAHNGGGPSRRPAFDDIEALKSSYLMTGKEHAVMQLLLDMTKETLRVEQVLILADILFGSATLRDSDVSIQRSSGAYKKTTPPGDILSKLSELIKGFNQSLAKKADHPILLAIQLHHGITKIHPFKDWNGRIARLMLNVALMKTGCLPILIARTERRTYYETLEMADMGDFSPLVSFIADKQLESIEAFASSPEYLSIKGKYELERRLAGLDHHDRCLVLTEDSTSNNLLSVLLQSSGFKLDETHMLSYEGCSKIASANLFSIFVKERMPNLQVMVHRDRDYLTDSEIEYQHETFHRIDVRFFYTEGTDVESYFLNAAHLHALYPSLSRDTAEALVEDTISEVLPKSIDYLYKKEFGNRRETTTHLYDALVYHVKNNRFRFTHGKTAKQVLEHKLREFIREKARIDRPSPALHVPQLAKIARRIWKTPL
jgi:hypothetical protein